MLHAVSITTPTTADVAWNPSVPDVVAFEVWVKNSTSAWYQKATLPNTTFAYTITGLNTNDSLYCVSVRAIDSCAGNKSSFANADCAIQLAAFGQDQADSLNWTLYSGFTNPGKQYIQEQNALGTWVMVDSVPATVNHYVHKRLACNTTHVYRILTKNLVGGYTTTSDTAHALVFDTIAPRMPKLKVASVTIPGTIDVFWARGEGDVGTYLIETRTANTPFVLAATRPATDSSYSITGLNVQDSVFCVRIRAVDTCAANTSVWSAVHCPVQLEGTAGQNTIALSWTQYTGFTPLRQIIERFNGTTWVGIDSVPAAANTWVRNNLGCNVPYVLRIHSRGAKYNSYSDTVHLTPFDTVAPGKPALLIATVANHLGVRLQFTRTAPDIGTFEVYRAVPGQPFALVATLPATDTSIIDAVPDANANRYCYFVIAVDSCNPLNRSLPSDTLCTSTLALSTGACTTLIKLNWTPVQGLQRAALGYKIYRGLVGGPLTLLTTRPLSDTEYVDQTVAHLSTYTYRVDAYTAGPNVHVSSTDTTSTVALLAITPIPPTLRVVSVVTTSTSTGQVKLKWNRQPLTDTASRGYNVYRAASKNGPFVFVANVPNLNTDSLLVPNLNTSTAYNWFLVRTYNGCGRNSDSIGKTMPAINVVGVRGNSSARLHWNPYPSAGASGYRILRSVGSSPFVPFATVADTTFSDSTHRCGYTYSYQVQLIDTGANNNALSDTLHITGLDTIPPPPPLVARATVLATSNTLGRIQLDFTAPATANRAGYWIYRIAQNGATSSYFWANPAAGLLQFTDQGLDTRNNTYRYFVRSVDSCSPSQSPMSEVHRTQNLSGLATNGVNQLNWTRYVGFGPDSIRVQRRTTNTLWATRATLPGTDTTFNDGNLKCDTLYYYQVVAKETATNELSYSDTVALRAFETNAPDAAIIASASVFVTGGTNGQISVRWHRSPSRDALRYVVQYRTAPANPWHTLGVTTDSTISHTATNNLDSVYEYQVLVIDSCGNISTPSITPHSTVRLKAIPGYEQNQLSWTPYQGWPVQNYVVERDGANLATLPANTFTYTDLAVKCPTLYTYRIFAIGAGPQDTAHSNTSVAAPMDTNAPLPVYIRYATVDSLNASIRVRIQRSPSADVRFAQILRSIDGAPYGPFGTIAVSQLPDTIFTDTDVQPALHTYCYMAIAYDGCGNRGAVANPACAITLSGFIEAHTGSAPVYGQLNWTAYRRWLGNTARYEVTRFTPGQKRKTLGQTLPVDLDYIDRDQDPTDTLVCYTIRALEGPGSFGDTSYSNTICILMPPHFLVPNAFSPGKHDNVNDTFQPGLMGVRSYDMHVYNRWG